MGWWWRRVGGGREKNARGTGQAAHARTYLRSTFQRGMRFVGSAVKRYVIRFLCILFQRYPFYCLFIAH